LSKRSSLVYRERQRRNRKKSFYKISTWIC
jgi:hypothetical protein